MVTSTGSLVGVIDAPQPASTIIDSSIAAAWMDETEYVLRIL
jgi:hypothetical protein